MVAPLNAMLLELPLLLAAWGFSIAILGLTGSHIHQFGAIQDKIEHQSGLPGFVTVDFDKMTNVEYALLITAALQFAFCLFAMVMSCEQLKKRRGEYSGKGTRAYLVVGLIQFLLLGLWTGAVCAYTAYSVMKYYRFVPGPAYSEPFTQQQQLYLRQIDYYIRTQSTNSLRVNLVPGFNLGEWSNFSTLEQANAYLNNHNWLDVPAFRATTAVGWFALGTVFLVTVVHFALPFVWRWLGLLREPKKNGSRYNDLM